MKGFSTYTFLFLNIWGGQTMLPAEPKNLHIVVVIHVPGWCLSNSVSGLAAIKTIYRVSSPASVGTLPIKYTGLSSAANDSSLCARTSFRAWTAPGGEWSIYLRSDSKCRLAMNKQHCNQSSPEPRVVRSVILFQQFR